MDYLLSDFRLTTATGWSAMMIRAVSHAQVMRFLSAQQHLSKHMWTQIQSEFS